MLSADPNASMMRTGPPSMLNQYVIESEMLTLWQAHEDCAAIACANKHLLIEDATAMAKRLECCYGEYWARVNHDVVLEKMLLLICQTQI